MHEHRTKMDSDAFGTNGLSEEYSPLPDQAEIESDRSHFSGTCETTLNDWIQLVQMGRRDAVVSVRTFDGKEGTLWCREGDIVDAHCDGVVGEAAVFRALSWRGGRVSVVFVPVTRHRLIQTATAGLLLEEAYRRDSGVHDLTSLAGSSESADLPDQFDVGSDTTEISAPSELLMQGQLAPQAEWLVHDEDQQSRHSLDDPPDLRASISLPFAVAGGLSVMLLFSLIAWKWTWPSQSDVASTRLPAPLVVVRDVSPANGGPLSSPRGDVMASRPTSAPAATPSVSVKKATAPRPAAYSSVLVRHHAASVPPRRMAATSATALRSPTSDGPKASLPSRIEVIKEDPAVPSQPHVQIIEETAQHRQPRIQIIQDRKPHIETVE